MILLAQDQDDDPDSRLIMQSKSLILELPSRLVRLILFRSCLARQCHRLAHDRKSSNDAAACKAEHLINVGPAAPSPSLSRSCPCWESSSSLPPVHRPPRSRLADPERRGGGPRDSVLGSLQQMRCSRVPSARLSGTLWWRSWRSPPSAICRSSADCGPSVAASQGQSSRVQNVVID